MVSVITLVTVVVCCIVNSMLCHPVGNEPQCFNRFDYDVKLLEKMISLEHRVNLSEKLLRDEIGKLEADKKRLEENIDSLSKQLTEEQQRATKEIKLKSEQVDSKLETMLANLSQKSEQVDSEVDTKIDSLSKQLTKKQELSTKEIKLKSDEVDAKLGTMLANFSQLADRKTADQKAFAAGVATSLEVLESRINTSLQTFAEKALKPAVAFYMRYTGTGAPYTNAMLKFSTAFVNTDNVYDTQTGLFTAPVSGVYVFSVQICGYKNKYINFRIYVNDDMISDTTEYDSDSADHCTSTNAVAMLGVGDKVCVKTGPRTNTGNTLLSASDRWSTFMGTLVH